MSAVCVCNVMRYEVAFSAKRQHGPEDDPQLAVKQSVYVLS